MSSPDATPSRGLLRHRDFCLLWAGQSTSDVGTAVSAVVLPLIAVVYLHATAFEVGALSAAEWVPWLLIGLPAGVWVDRLRCGRLMIGCDIVRALAIGTVPVAAAFDALGITQLFAVAAVTGFATVVFQVAYAAYLSTLVDTEHSPRATPSCRAARPRPKSSGPASAGSSCRSCARRSP